MIERFPAPNRQHRCRITLGGWTRFCRSSWPVYGWAWRLEFGLSVAGPDRPEQRARLEESRDFFGFSEFDANELVRRWEEYRKRARDHERDDRSGG
jgi:hypothetical protein